MREGSYQRLILIASVKLGDGASKNLAFSRVRTWLRQGRRRRYERLSLILVEGSEDLQQEEFLFGDFFGIRAKQG